VRPADRFDRDRLDDERLARHQEAVLLPVLALEFHDDIRHVFDTRLERRVGALVLEVQRALRPRFGRRDALRLDVGAGSLPPAPRACSRPPPASLRQRGFERLLLQRAHVGEPIP
jgi:hypothetical protein